MPPLITPPIENYFHFIKLSQKIDVIFNLNGFCPNKKALFHEIILAWFNEVPLTVREAMAISYLGSPATLHKRIAGLRDLKLVHVVHLSGNMRTKYLQPTDSGLKYIEMLAHCLAHTSTN